MTVINSQHREKLEKYKLTQSVLMEFSFCSEMKAYIRKYFFFLLSIPQYKLLKVEDYSQNEE